jgi:uncharacterized protein (TIGR02646 family)
MIKLRRKNLPASLRQKLKTAQALIDSLASYEEQVKAASEAWGKKDKKTFQAVRRILEEMCPGVHRCVYCEDAHGDHIEHFHPKKFYPEFTFDWDNYLLACTRCNSNFKRDTFAVLADDTGKRYDLMRGKHEVIIAPPKGEPLLINPRYENPLDYLQLDIARTFHVQSRLHLTGFDLERANYTIEVFQLNTRPELPKWRENAFRNFIGWIDSYGNYKADSETKALKAHRNALAKYNHLSVWEEMRRVYQNRGSNWSRLITRSLQLQAIDRRFSAYPELLNITFIP